MKIALILTVAVCSMVFTPASAKEKLYGLNSPDKKTEIKLHVAEDLKISAVYNSKVILLPSPVAMELEGETLGKNPVVKKTEKHSISEEIMPVIREKNARIENRCNELKVFFEGDYYLVLRAYNNGFAYRFGTDKEGQITVLSETGEYEFPDNYMMWWGKEKTFESHNQVFFDYRSLRNTGSEDLTSLPLILDPLNGPKIVIAETGLLDYPGMWLRGSKRNMLYRVSAKYPKKIEQRSDRYLPITERENYIAVTGGKRNFPWRIFAIAPRDEDLIENQLTYILASEQKIDDVSWIRPGKVAWDWWNANNIYGVDFKAGINTQTYKYYIDFASAYGIEYILLDEGWYKLGDIMEIVPGIDMEEILRYAESKNVGVMLWCVWKALDDKMDEAMDRFEQWGIKGIKVDFMNRDDQQMVNFYYKTAKKAAEHHLMVDFHGSYKPAGLRRMFPNVLTREGVNGGEEFKWSMHQTPEHDLIIPFGRMLAGPMDYTPGAMHNAQEKDYKPIFDTPMSMGTRCHQLAMYVCYESPLQMLCDSPSNYYKEPECMEFLSDVPTVWDTTIVLNAAVSDYLVVARKHGEKWYVGGMTDWDERDMEIRFSFLAPGKNYAMNMYKDGLNANRIGIDFMQVKSRVDNTFSETIHLAKGGGFAIILEPVE